MPVLLLRILGERYDQTDAHHIRLLQLAGQLESHQDPVPKSDVVLSLHSITWLHLSDLHFRESHTYNENAVLKAFLEN